MILPIYLYGWPLLRKPSEDITPDYPDLQKLIADMFETMYKADGVGLAGPQVGLNIRIFVVDASPLDEDDPSLAGFKKTFINAHITQRGGEPFLYNEGCLSLPGIHEDVSRPSWIEMTYCDENFVEHHERFEGYAARVIQHEYDHLDGKLFIDYVSPLRRKLLLPKLTIMAKGKARTSYKIKRMK